MLRYSNWNEWRQTWKNTYRAFFLPLDVIITTACINLNVDRFFMKCFAAAQRFSLYFSPKYLAVSLFLLNRMIIRHNSAMECCFHDQKNCFKNVLVTMFYLVKMFKSCYWFNFPGAVLKSSYTFVLYLMMLPSSSFFLLSVSFLSYSLYFGDCAVKTNI